MHKLPAMFAQRIAMRLKGWRGGELRRGYGSKCSESEVSQAAPSKAAQADLLRAAPAGVVLDSAGGAPDFQQMLSRMPEVKVGELKRGAR